MSNKGESNENVHHIAKQFISYVKAGGRATDTYGNTMQDGADETKTKGPDSRLVTQPKVPVRLGSVGGWWDMCERRWDDRTVGNGGC